MDYIEALQKRYSVKKFDKEKEIPQPVLQRILQAGKLSASSLGLQPYKIFVIESKEAKQKITPAFLNPSQISTCSHLIVIVAKKAIEDEYIDGYFRHISEVRQIPVENLAPFRSSINYFRGLRNDAEIITWNEKQGYIMLGNLMFAAALEGVDSCPLEGFVTEKLDELLELDTSKLRSAVTLALGYRDSDDPYQNLKKVRKPDDKLFEIR